MHTTTEAITLGKQRAREFWPVLSRTEVAQPAIGLISEAGNVQWDSSVAFCVRRVDCGLRTVVRLWVTVLTTLQSVEPFPDASHRGRHQRRDSPAIRASRAQAPFVCLRPWRSSARAKVSSGSERRQDRDDYDNQAQSIHETSDTQLV